MPDNFDSDLEVVLRREVKNFLALESCKQLTAGASQETYRITLSTDTGQRHLALRRSRLDTPSSVGTISLATEASLFRLAGANRIPSPAIVYILRPEDGIGAGFLMEWLEGETLGQRIVRAPEFEAVRPRLARSCGEILGRIHSLNWREAGLDKVLPVVEPRQLVDETWALYRDFNIPVPMIDYTWRWLTEYRTQRLTLYFLAYALEGIPKVKAL